MPSQRRDRHANVIVADVVRVAVSPDPDDVPEPFRPANRPPR